MLTPIAAAAPVRMDGSRRAPGSQSRMLWALGLLGAALLSACGQPTPAADPAEPEALAQAPLALTQNSDGAWEWAERRVTTPDLNTIWGNSTTDVWAAGTRSGILHWNGTSWRRIANPGMGETIWGLWGTGPNNVYAVGDDGLCMRWNGTSWRRIDLPIPSGTALNDIWGSGSNDIWIVGDDALVVRYNGTNWTTLPTTGVNSLWSVWGSSSNNVWMVGELGYMLRWDGTKLDEFGSGGSVLYTRIRGFSANKSWLIGAGSVYAWDGTRWSAASSMLTGGTSPANLFLNNDTSLWFTNYSETRHWNGMTSVRYGNSAGTAVWTQGTTDGWLVGPGATILRLSSATTTFSNRW